MCLVVTMSAGGRSAVSESMKGTVVFRLFVCTILTSAVLSIWPGDVPAVHAQTAADPTFLKVAPLKYNRRTLANGLTFLSI